MTAVSLKNCDEVKVDIVEPPQQQSQPIPSVNQSKKESIKTTNQQSCAKILVIILFGISFYIVGCEVISFGVKIISTTPKDAILYRYRIIGGGLVTIVGLLPFQVALILLLRWFISEPKIKIFDFIKYYCTRKEEPISIPWYQQKRFAKSAVAVSIVLIWLVMFEIGHIFYVICPFTNDVKQEFSRSMVYFTSGLVIFIIWLAILGVTSAWIIITWIFEKTLD